MMKILIADDHLPVRLGFKMMVEDILGRCEIDFAVNGVELFEKLESKPYDILISDLNMPRLNIMQLVPNALVIQPKLKILVMSVNPEEIFARRLLAAGAYGYLQKDASDDDIRNAIKNISLGKKFLSQTQMSDISMLIGSDQDKSSNPFSKLSSREMEVTLLLLKGYGPLEVSNTLNITSSTASSLKSRIFDKLEIINIVELTNMARAYGLVDGFEGGKS